MAGLIGGVIGLVVGGPIGFLIGSLLGNLLFPSTKGQEGPRLNNLRLQGSSYGAVIPITYGENRLAGQVIWQTDLKEHKHTSGGKGGPRLASPPAPFNRIIRAVGGSGGKGGPQVTTYTYTASFAIKYCKGPKGGLATLWANGAIIYDTSGNLDVDNSKIPVTIYLGVETAEPDPTMEAELGVGNVPAFRDDFVLVFTDMDLGDFGNTLPQMHAKIFDAAGPIPWRVSTFEPFNTDEGSGGGINPGPQDGRIEDGKLVISKWTDTPAGIGGVTIGFQIKTFDIDGNELSDDSQMGDALPCDDPPTNTHFRPCLNNPHIAFAYSNGGGINGSGYYHEGTIAWKGAIPGQTAYGNPQTNPVYSKIADAVYNIAGNTTAVLMQFPCTDGVPTSEIPLATYSLWTHTGVDPANHAAPYWNIIADEETGNIWALAKNVGGLGTYIHLIKFDKDLNVLHDWAQDDLPGGAAFTSAGLAFTVWSDVICLTSGLIPGSVVTAYYIDPVSYTFTETVPGTINAFQPYVNSPSNVISLGNGLALVGNGIISLAPQGGPVTLASIVRDLSLRAGLTDADIDVSQLTDLVDGYIVSTQADCRTQIEPLRTAFFFDAVESQGVVKFVKRGGQLAVTIPDEDLAAIDASTSQDKVPRRVEPRRGSEHDLPATVNVTYMNIDAGYENGTQQARRQVGSSQAVSSVELAIAMSDSKAKQIANVLCFGAWMERTSIKIRTTRKYAAYEPTDLISAGGYIFRVEKKSEGVGGVIEFEGVVDNPFLYLAAPASNATSGSGTTPVARRLQKTTALLLDIPLIIDTDDANGFYAAMAGAVDDTWRGATLDESRDGGTIWFDVETDTVPDVMGVAASALGDFGGGNIFDRINTVSVVIGPGGGALANASRTSVLNGANAALIGDEIVQFMTASLIAPSTYLLSDFLRGRQGTEYAMATHASADRFVLLPVNDVARPFADLALPWDYKPVTIGDTLAATTLQSFTNTGARLRCYSPVQLGGGVDDLGAIILKWNRRTRIGGLWLNYVDALLSESTEAYVLNIYSDNTFASVVQTFNVTPASFFYPGQPSFRWTLADQNDAFGSYPQAFAYWGVSQVGTLGPGIESRQTTP